MNKIFNLDSVDQYNKLYGLETLNPLVSVIDLNKATRQMNYAHWHYGIYALYLKLEKACDIRYGRQNYDYQEGTRSRASECTWHTFSSGFITRNITWQDNQEIHVLLV